MNAVCFVLSIFMRPPPFGLSLIPVVVLLAFGVKPYPEKRPRYQSYLRLVLPASRLVSPPPFGGWL